MAIGLDVRQNQNREAAQNNSRQEKAAGATEKRKDAEQILSDLKANRVSDVSEVSKAERVDAKQESAPRASERPTRDRYVPETAEDRASFGRYQPVSDGEDGAKIQFDAPSDGKKPEKADSAKAGPSPDAAGKAEAKASAEPAKMQTAPANVSVLKNKQKALEKQLKSTSDAETRKEIKKKLEQIKRQLKAASN